MDLSEILNVGASPNVINMPSQLGKRKKNQPGSGIAQHFISAARKTNNAGGASGDMNEQLNDLLVNRGIVLQSVTNANGTLLFHGGKVDGRYLKVYPSGKYYLAGAKGSNINKLPSYVKYAQGIGGELFNPLPMSSYNRKAFTSRNWRTGKQFNVPASTITRMPGIKRSFDIYNRYYATKHNFERILRISKSARYKLYDYLYQVPRDFWKEAYKYALDYNSKHKKPLSTINEQTALKIFRRIVSG